MTVALRIFLRVPRGGGRVNGGRSTADVLLAGWKFGSIEMSCFVKGYNCQ